MKKCKKVLEKAPKVTGSERDLDVFVNAISGYSSWTSCDNVDVMVLPRLEIAKNTSVGRFADNTNRIKYAFENIDCENAIIYWDDTYALLEWHLIGHFCFHHYFYVNHQKLKVFYLILVFE